MALFAKWRWNQEKETWDLIDKRPKPLCNPEGFKMELQGTQWSKVGRERMEKEGAEPYKINMVPKDKILRSQITDREAEILCLRENLHVLLDAGAKPWQIALARRELKNAELALLALEPRADQKSTLEILEDIHESFKSVEKKMGIADSEPVREMEALLKRMREAESFWEGRDKEREAYQAMCKRMGLPDYSSQWGPEVKKGWFTRLFDNLFRLKGV